MSSKALLRSGGKIRVRKQRYLPEEANEPYPGCLGKKIIFRFKDAPDCYAVLNEIVNMYNTIPQRYWTEGCYYPKDSSGQLLSHLTFRLRVSITPDEVYYTAVYVRPDGFPRQKCKKFKPIRV
ncbi:hypothetical protein TNCT_321311 [Trichonephila clavata]|uniref:Uncharacterized protein n=1 Tax=Trichonephila clavata TaxID=2740835 RepID=A0A8X6FMT2_TRICU|nr:hypothetical protein TNCT_321311 [Trichonephila clavata]